MKLRCYILLVKLLTVACNLLVRFLKLYVYIKPQKNQLIESVIVKIFDTAYSLLEKVRDWRDKIRVKIIWRKMFSKEDN